MLLEHIGFYALSRSAHEKADVFHAMLVTVSLFIKNVISIKVLQIIVSLHDEAAFWPKALMAEVALGNL